MQGRRVRTRSSWLASHVRLLGLGNIRGQMHLVCRLSIDTLCAFDFSWGAFERRSARANPADRRALIQSIDMLRPTRCCPGGLRAASAVSRYDSAQLRTPSLYSIDRCLAFNSGFDTQVFIALRSEMVGGGTNAVVPSTASHTAPFPSRGDRELDYLA